MAGEGKWYYMSDLRKMKVGADDPKAVGSIESESCSLSLCAIVVGLDGLQCEDEQAVGDGVQQGLQAVHYDSGRQAIHRQVRGPAPTSR